MRHWLPLRAHLFYLALILGVAPAMTRCALAAENGDSGLPRTLTDAHRWFNASDLPATFATPPPSEERPDLVTRGKTRLLEGSGRLIGRMNLKLRVGGWDSTLPATEEYRLDPADASGQATIYFSEAFWSAYFKGLDIHLEHDHDLYAGYLVYVLLRAQAEVDYGRLYDAEHFTWAMQDDAEGLSYSLRMLKKTLDLPSTSWEAPDGPLSPMGEDFRRALRPDGDPKRTLQALIHFAFGALSHRAADLYALSQYRTIVGDSPTGQIERRVMQRNREQYWDFGRAKAAMTLGERMAFKQSLAHASTLLASR